MAYLALRVKNPGPAYKALGSPQWGAVYPKWSQLNSKTQISNTKQITMTEIQNSKRFDNFEKEKA
jgi:hypothetical protein